MSRQDNNESDNDPELFREAVQDVKPLHNDRVRLRPPCKQTASTRKKSPPVDRLSDDFIPPCDTWLEFMRPGVQLGLFRQLRTGRLPPEAHLDLHGMTRDAARLGLQQFLLMAQQQHLRVVCIVHGKGYHSEDGRPVLKAMVNKWLQDLPEVLAFCSAKPEHGGSGAVYALLKSSKPRTA